GGPLRLQGDRAADRAEAEDAERGGAHGGESSGNPAGRKREGRPLEAAPRQRSRRSRISTVGSGAHGTACGIEVQVWWNGTKMTPHTLNSVTTAVPEVITRPKEKIPSSIGLKIGLAVWSGPYIVPPAVMSCVSFRVCRSCVPLAAP